MNGDTPNRNTSAPLPPLGESRRWVLVGDEGDAERLSAMLGNGDPAPPITAVPSFLAAVSEVGREAAEVVIGPAAAIDGMALPLARALRELAPEAKLLVVAEEAEAEHARRAVDAGFDAAIRGAVTPEALREAMGEAPHDHEAAAGDADAAGEMDEGGENVELGDVDLINAILRGAKVEPYAIRVIETRAALTGVKRVRDEAQVPEDFAAARVALRGREFGLIHAPPPATDADLEPWAGWLAHWLALDEQVGLLKDMSMRDPLTGVWNRRYFERFLKRILEWATRERSQVTLLVFDIDDFKIYNDKYGHGAGDEILRETSRLMQSVVREHDVVARIGGDEFAVIFWDADPKEAPRIQGSRHPEDVVKATTRFREAVLEHKFPKLLDEAPGRLTISGGLASFPWDGRTPDELLAKADEMSIRSKRQGKNALTFGPGAERAIRDRGS